MSRAVEWVLGIAGAIAAFLGLFIMFAGESSSVGIGGDLSWRVGDIAPAWGYGLLIVGVFVLGLASILMMRDRRRPGVQRQATELQTLVTHIVVFAVVNAFIWLQDLAIGGGIDYAWAVTIPWGVGVIAHIIAYIVGSRRAAPHH
jgi:hypothetical protein